MGRATVIDGSALAADLRLRVGEVAASLRQRAGISAGLATILVGDSRSSQVYVRAKGRACHASGLAAFDIRLPANISQADLAAELARVNRNDNVDGILVQLPLPRHLDPENAIAAVDPAKDVTVFIPSMSGGCGAERSGWCLAPRKAACCCCGLRIGTSAAAEAVILGRSNIVGKPLAALLLGADCTVTMVHSRTRDTAAICRRADILIAAIGRPGVDQGGLGKAGRDGDRCRHQPGGGSGRREPGRR